MEALLATAIRETRPRPCSWRPEPPTSQHRLRQEDAGTSRGPGCAGCRWEAEDALGTDPGRSGAGSWHRHPGDTGVTMATEGGLKPHGTQQGVQVWAVWMCPSREEWEGLGVLGSESQEGGSGGEASEPQPHPLLPGLGSAALLSALKTRTPEGRGESWALRTSLCVTWGC